MTSSCLKYKPLLQSTKNKFRLQQFQLKSSANMQAHILSYNNTGNSHVIVFVAHELKFIACVFWDLPFVLLMPSCIMFQIELYSCTKRTFTKSDAFSISTPLSFYFRKMGKLLFETRERSRKIRNLKFLKNWEKQKFYYKTTK